MIKNYYRASLVLSSSSLTYLLTTDRSAGSREKCRVRGVSTLAGGREVFGVIQVVGEFINWNMLKELYSLRAGMATASPPPGRM